MEKKEVGVHTKTLRCRASRNLYLFPPIFVIPALRLAQDKLPACGRKAGTHLMTSPSARRGRCPVPPPHQMGSPLRGKDGIMVKYQYDD